MSKLLEYFNAVDKNAVARDAHRAAPIASMSAFGLTVEEQNAVLSGSLQSLAEAIGLSAIDIPVMHVPNTVFTPGADASNGVRRFSGEIPVIHLPNSVFLPAQQSLVERISTH